MHHVLPPTTFLCAFAALLLLSFAGIALAQSDDEPHPVPAGLGPKILGADEASVEEHLGMEPTLLEEEWRYYGKNIGVRFEAERAVELIVVVPGGMSCDEAAEWMGYPDAAPPLRKSSACLWPGQSERHRIADGVIGSLYLKQAQFSVKLQSASP